MIVYSKDRKAVIWSAEIGTTKRNCQRQRDGDTLTKRQIRGQIGLGEAGRQRDVYAYMCVSLCPSWASAEQQHRGQVKWGGEIKGSAGACSLCIQSPLSPAPQPACWSSCSERIHAPCHSHKQVQRLHTSVATSDFYTIMEKWNHHNVINNTASLTDH